MAEQQFDIVNLLNDKKGLIKYILDMMTSSEKFAQNLPQIHESGYSTKFLAEFLGLVPLLSATLIPARKKTQSDTKSMTTENFETHG